MVLINARLGIVFETSSNVVTFYGRSKTHFKKKLFNFLYILVLMILKRGKPRVMIDKQTSQKIVRK